MVWAVFFLVPSLNLSAAVDAARGAKTVEQRGKAARHGIKIPILQGFEARVKRFPIFPPYVSSALALPARANVKGKQIFQPAIAAAAVEVVKTKKHKTSTEQGKSSSVPSCYCSYQHGVIVSVL